MSYEEIKARHDSCVKRGSRHNAHADRGELLQIIKEIKLEQIAKALKAKRGKSDKALTKELNEKMTKDPDHVVPPSGWTLQK